jgi:hypothetical protein
MTGRARSVSGAALLLGLIALSMGATVTSAAAEDCDRQCLSDVVTLYLDALVAHNPAALPAAGRIRFIEDSVEKKLGDGLWKTASKLRPYRQDIIDVREQTAGAFVVVEEGTSPVLLVLRLTLVDKKITEAETMVTRNQREGLTFQIDALQKPNKAMTDEPERRDLDSRGEAIRIAEHYPAGLKAGSFVTADTPFSSDAYRSENGRLTAGPGCTFAAGCDNIKTQKITTFAGITDRVGAVDEQFGIVLIKMDLGAGSVPAAGSSLVVWAAFKVYGGTIHAVEAVTKVMPLGTKPGRD